MVFLFLSRFLNSSIGTSNSVSYKLNQATSPPFECSHALSASFQFFEVMCFGEYISKRWSL